MSQRGGSVSKGLCQGCQPKFHLWVCRKVGEDQLML